MAESAYLPGLRADLRSGLAAQESHRADPARFPALVRFTHWVTTLSFLGLLISGFAILLAHPRRYWGETGGLGGPYLLAFPLPTMKGGPSGWGRSLHFLSSFIAEWTGVSLSHVLNLVGVLPQAKYIVFFAMDGKFDSLDLADAWHPQSLLAYFMNGQDLPTRHGAPLRVRVPRQLGFKSKKYLARIFATDNVKNIGSGQGSSSPDKGYAWYGGI